MKLDLGFFIIFIIVVIKITFLQPSPSKLTNIKCDELDKKFGTFKECRLKLIKRGTVALNVFLKINQFPINNALINLALLKKANGYKPFLYNKTTNFCNFMKNKNQQLFLKIYFDLLSKSSNLNHTCPYNHDIIVSNLVLNDYMFKLLPLPTGEYMFKLKVAANNSWKIEVKAYFQYAGKEFK